jgi:tRNA(fMet)-specific endonuclease VapC
MPAYLLDTNAISDIMMDHPRIKIQVAAHSGHYATSAIARGEIRYGLERLPIGKRRTTLEQKAAAVLAAMPCEPVTESAADTYGVIRRETEAKGVTLGDNDLWIAATALTLGAIVVSRDQGFRHVPGLLVEDWTQ